MDSGTKETERRGGNGTGERPSCGTRGGLSGTHWRRRDCARVPPTDSRSSEQHLCSAELPPISIQSCLLNNITLNPYHSDDYSWRPNVDSS